MSCSKIMDMVYEEDSITLLNQIQIGLHTFFCPACAEEIERYQTARTVMREDFFPPLSSIEDSVMAKVSVENEQTEDSYANAGVLSTRGWVIAGCLIMVSLVTAFFGLDFQNLARELGMSFMLPMGITIGIVLTTYGALFIGSHLKELSERFGL